MAKTSAAAKNRYIQKAYDRITFVVKKSATPKLKAHIQTTGETMSAYIKRLIIADIGDIDL